MIILKKCPKSISSVKWKILSESLKKKQKKSWNSPVLIGLGLSSTTKHVDGKLRLSPTSSIKNFQAIKWFPISPVKLQSLQLKVYAKYVVSKTKWFWKICVVINFVKTAGNHIYRKGLKASIPNLFLLALIVSAESRLLLLF